jgi:glycerophosphoryl diester phosphodiesterase
MKAPVEERRGAKPADFLRIAHRGASGERPENTLGAFRRALELGAGMIECDLRLCADGHVIVLHDAFLERTTSGYGAARDQMLADIRHFDAGAWRGAEFAGEVVPTLEETLDLVLPRARLNLELKSEGEDPRMLALATVAAVSQRRALDRVVFSSFDFPTLVRIREASPHAQIGVLWGELDFTEAWSRAREVGAVALHPRAETVTTGVIAAARDRGLLVFAWTVNSRDRMVELVRSGADGLMSDFPGRLLEARAQLLGDA